MSQSEDTRPVTPALAAELARWLLGVTEACSFTSAPARLAVLLAHYEGQFELRPSGMSQAYLAVVGARVLIFLPADPELHPRQVTDLVGRYLLAPDLPHWPGPAEDAAAWRRWAADPDQRLPLGRAFADTWLAGTEAPG